MLTLCAVERSSLAADPHDRLMDEATWAEMEARLLFLVQTHDWSSVTASGHLSFVKYWMLRLIADLIHGAWKHCLSVRSRELGIWGVPYQAVVHRHVGHVADGGCPGRSGGQSQTGGNRDERSAHLGGRKTNGKYTDVPWAASRTNERTALGEAMPKISSSQSGKI
jgi:hypothetical protein